MGRRGVTVNVVSPGYIDTEMTRGLTEKDKEKITSNIVLHRLGHVSDVANAVHYLASDEAGYVTGAVLNVNGGLYM
jgi:3-oxoacyl-[acyl-carrier protein] reductase